MNLRIYKGNGGYPVYTIEENRIYKGTGGGYPIYKINGNRVYNGDGSGYPIYTINGNRIYKGSGGGYPVYYIDGNRIYNGDGSGYPIYCIDGQEIAMSANMAETSSGIESDTSSFGCGSSFKLLLLIVILIFLSIAMWPVIFSDGLDISDLFIIATSVLVPVYMLTKSEIGIWEGLFRAYGVSTMLVIIVHIVVEFFVGSIDFLRVLELLFAGVLVGFLVVIPYFVGYFIKKIFLGK